MPASSFLPALDSARPALVALVVLLCTAGSEAETHGPSLPIAQGPTFVQEAQIFGHGDPVGLPNASLGRAVALDGDTLAVGAPGEGTAAGSYAGVVHVFVRSGATWIEEQKLTASDGAPGDAFGSAVALSADTLVVGAPSGDTPAGQDAGSAYVFVRTGTTWVEQQKLLATGAGPYHRFGSSVSVSGDTALVGDPGDTAPAGFGSGSARVFVRSGATWTEQQGLSASNAQDVAFFGESASLSGDTAVVGALEEDTSAGTDAGAAYVFVRSGSTWTQQQRLTASDAAALDLFGSSVSIWGDTLAVGAKWDDDAGEYSGSAYLFVRSGSTWTEQQKLVAGAIYDTFGDAVSLSGDTLVVGSSAADTASGVDAGAAYVFVRSGATWSLEQRLTASDGGPLDRFGSSVAVSENAVAVGAPDDDTPATDSGSAHVFARTGGTWSEQQQFELPDSVGGDVFGFSVAVSGDTAVVGARADPTLPGCYGSAYVFVRSGIGWVEEQKLTAPDCELGDSFGTAVAISGDTLVVGAREAPQGSGVGAAYVFVRSGTTWTHQQKLMLAGGQPTDYFGGSVAISGDTVVIGAAGDSSVADDAGAAYVFLRSGSTWAQQQRLTASDAAAHHYFGYSVSVSGETAVAGAPDLIFGGPGSAYVFVRSGTTWSEEQKLGPNVTNDQFGVSVSIDGDTLAAGATYDLATYVFVRSGTTWTQQQRLTPSDGASGDLFGQSVSLGNDALAVGAPSADAPAADAGAVYVFARTTGIWTEEQKLTMPGGASGDVFGARVALAGSTLLAGAPDDDTVAGADAGSALIFRGLTAMDVGVTKTDGQVTAVPGEPVTYGITVTSAGPDPAIGARVVDTPPAALTGVTWICSPSPGSSCPASGSGAIDHVVTLPVGGALAYSLRGTISPGATGSLSNSVSVAPPAGVADPNPANDSATDTDTLMPVGELSVTTTDGQTIAVPGQPVTYTIVVANTGPSDIVGAIVTDIAPSALPGATWTCAASPGSACTSSGSGSISDSVALLVDGSLSYTFGGIVDAAATVSLVNTATTSLPPGASDPNPANNTATDTDVLPVSFPTDGELTPGYDRWLDLAALPGPVADEDVFRIYQQRHASYEVLLDSASGDLGSGAGPLLERLASDVATVLQGSSPAGAGGSRSLRWMNALEQPVVDEFVRVRSAGCTTGCDSADVYRLRARETTGFIARFNNSGTQVTVLVLANTDDQPIDMDVRLWSANGTSLGGSLASLGPRGSYVLDTSTIAPGSGGSITVGNTGRYGQLTGKAVAIEPGTGFTFDSALERRTR